MKQISSHLTFAIFFYASVAGVAMIFGLLGMPEEIARPMVSGAIIIALFLSIVSMVKKALG